MLLHLILQVLCSALAGWWCSVDQHFESFSLDDSIQTSHPVSNTWCSRANSFGYLADNPFSFPAAILADILYMSSSLMSFPSVHEYFNHDKDSSYHLQGHLCSLSWKYSLGTLVTSLWLHHTNGLAIATATTINLDTPVPLPVTQHLGFEKVGPCPWRELLNKSLSFQCSLVPLSNTKDLSSQCSCDLNNRYQNTLAGQVSYILAYRQSSMLLSEVPGQTFQEWRDVATNKSGAEVPGWREKVKSSVAPC